MEDRPGITPGSLRKPRWGCRIPSQDTLTALTKNGKTFILRRHNKKDGLSPSFI